MPKIIVYIYIKIKQYLPLQKIITMRKILIFIDKVESFWKLVIQ